MFIFNLPKILLFHKRFRKTTWLALVGTISGQYFAVALLVFIIVVYQTVRFFYLWPYEQNWLNKIRSLIESMSYDEAIRLLEKKPLWCSYTACLRAQQLKVKIHLRGGEFLKAHHDLIKIDTDALFPAEKIEQSILRAKFYYSSQDIEAFLNEVNMLTDEQIVNSTEGTLFKALSLQETGEYSLARQCLEQRINITSDAKDLVSLYNNLANLEGISHRKKQQLSYLEIAYTSWLEHPHPEGLYNIVHNLIMSLLRQGKITQAKKVLTIVFNTIDKSNKKQVMLWYNLSIEAGRESSKKSWLFQTYQDFEIIKNELNLTPAESFLLAVSELRMHFNDNLSKNITYYINKINELLNSIDVLSTIDQVPALSEIFTNIQVIISSNFNVPYLNKLYDDCGSMLLQRKSVIKAQVQSFPPSLVCARQQWVTYLILLDKVNISRAIEYPKAAFESLFSHYQENVSFYQDKKIERMVIHEFMLICDDYLAYIEQLPPCFSSQLHDSFNDLALYSLEEMEKLLKKNHHSIGFEEYMIGFAALVFKLKGNKEQARYWISCFDKTKFNTNHYAHWLRSRYEWTKQQVLDDN